MKRYLNSGTLIKVIAIWLALSTGLETVIAMASPPNTRAVFLMAVSLVVLWAGLCGLALRFFRDPLRRRVQTIRLDWRLNFILMATVLALVEEAITTTLTNLAPWFGVPLGAAYITASANYLDVVCFHSVVVFIPMFIGWAVLLHFFNFRPNSVFLLFGMTGLIGEIVFGGLQALGAFGMWIFVYGLMVYLPAYATLPADRSVKEPKVWQYGLAVFVPLAFAVPVAILVSTLHPVGIHFPPIPPGS
ncbi:MAG: hypothetical protein HGA86_00405 [Anaerolineaceae bacterium]|nr:hypothetical protein [Anaerolineaceae bacterium]